MKEPDIYDLVAQAERNEPNGAEPNSSSQPGQDTPEPLNQNETDQFASVIAEGIRAGVTETVHAVMGDSTPLDQIDPPILAGRQYTLAQVKTAAYNGEFPAPTVPMPDRVLWITLRDAYAQYRSGKVSKEQGEMKINEAIKQYRQDMTQYNDMIGVVHHIATFWKQIEAAASEYAKSPDRTAEADKFYNAVYGAIPK